MGETAKTIPFYWGVGYVTNPKTGEREKYDAKLTPEDIIEMQCIDADCNDCKHFKRGEFVKKAPAIFPALTKDGMIALNKEGSFFRGFCAKTGNATTAHPGQYSGRECFEHRRK